MIPHSSKKSEKRAFCIRLAAIKDNRQKIELLSCHVSQDLIPVYSCQIQKIVPNKGVNRRAK